MNKFIKKTLIVGIVSLLTISCEKEINTFSNDSAMRSSLKSELTVIEFSDIDSLGYFHNQILMNAANADHNSIEDLRNHFTSTYSLEYSASDYSMDDLFNLSVAIHDTLREYDYDIRNWGNSPFNNNVLFHLDKIFLAIDDMEANDQNYSIFESSLNQIALEVAADTNLSATEKNNLKGTISATKSSILLWAPRALGGLGLYEDLENGVYKAARRNSWSWAAAGKADCGTSAVFWTAGAITWSAGILAPPAGLAVLGAWGISTAVGSVMGGFL